MPQGLKFLRRRIRSVQATAKITAAMKLVAASKLRRAEERAQASIPYSRALAEVLQAVASQTRATARLPLLQVREVRRTGILVVSADRGLCGPYNTQILRRLEEVRHEVGADALLFPVGRRARDYVERRRYPVGEAFAPLGDDPTDAQARTIGESVAGAFLRGEVDEVLLVSTQYVSAFSSRPQVRRLLPLAPPQAAGEPVRSPYEFEPDPETVLARLLPVYLNAVVYGALLEAKAAEHGARMVAMDNATRNARELVRTLTLRLNRLRQEAITKEIAELVGGAEAVQ